MTGAGSHTGDPLGEALGLAYAHLGKRDRTVAQVVAHLRRRGVEDAVVEAAVTELAEQRYLDDERFARRFAEDRRKLDGWGSERIERALQAAGVPADLIDGELGGRANEDELSAAVAVLRDRIRVAPTGERERGRALALLVRRGYELELAYDAVRTFERGSGAARDGSCPTT